MPRGNLRPKALTATKAEQLRVGARSVFNAALAEVTRGLPEEEASAVRYELALALHRITVTEMEKYG